MGPDALSIQIEFRRRGVFEVNLASSHFFTQVIVQPSPCCTQDPSVHSSWVHGHFSGGSGLEQVEPNFLEYLLVRFTTWLASIQKAR